MLIIVVLNSQSDISNILVISRSGSSAWYFSLNCVFCLSVCLVIFFLGSQTCLRGKRNYGKQTFSNMVLMCEVGKLYSLAIIVPYFGDPAPLDGKLHKCFWVPSPPYVGQNGKNGLGWNWVFPFPTWKAGAKLELGISLPPGQLGSGKIPVL